MPGRYYEDFKVGEEFISPARTITESDVVMFAGLTGDYNPLHTDEEFGKKTQFGTRIAHGLLGLAISTGLTTRLALTEGTVIAFLGMSEWNFTGPIKIGDTIHCRQWIDSMRETKKEDRGIVTFGNEVINQRGEVVQTGKKTIMIRRKSKV